MKRSQQNTAVNVDDCRYHTAASLAHEVEFQVPITMILGPSCTKLSTD